MSEGKTKPVGASAYTTPEPIPRMSDSPSVLTPQSRRSGGSPRTQITFQMPVIHGNMLFTAINTFGTFPMHLASQRTLANKVNDLVEEKYNLEKSEASVVDQSVVEIFRKKGLSSLYRGYPVFLLHTLMRLFVKEIAVDVIHQIRLFLKDPNKDVFGISPFHRHLLSRLKMRTDPDARNLDHETMVVKWLNDHLEEGDEIEDDVVTKEILDLLADVIAEVMCYPLLTIAHRQAVIDDDTGYSCYAMFNVSRVMDGGYGWLYRGLEYSIAKLCLNTTGRLAIDFMMDSVESIMDNVVTSEVSKYALNLLLQPLENMSNLEKARSSVPGLIDEEAELQDMVQVSFSNKYRWGSALFVLGVPVVLGSRYFMKGKS